MEKKKPMKMKKKFESPEKLSKKRKRSTNEINSLQNQQNMFVNEEEVNSGDEISGSKLKKPKIKEKNMKEEIIKEEIETQKMEMQEETKSKIVINQNWMKFKESKAKMAKFQKKTKKSQLSLPQKTKNNDDLDDLSISKVISLDCEMVGTETGDSMLARVVVVNEKGNLIYDKYVLPQEDVHDYRTKYSGIRENHLIPEIAFPFSQVQKEIAELMKGRIVVGHGLENDFRALFLSHPFRYTRDTAKYRRFQRSRGKPRKLKFLAEKYLGIKIQHGEHDPAEDARAALKLYQKFKEEWEDKVSGKYKKKRIQLKKKKLEERKKLREKMKKMATLEFES